MVIGGTWLTVSSVDPSISRLRPVGEPGQEPLSADFPLLGDLQVPIVACTWSFAVECGFDEAGIAAADRGPDAES